MEILVDIITKLKALENFSKNDEPIEKLFSVLGKWLYTELPLIRGQIFYSFFWKNKGVKASMNWSILNINKDGEMWYASGRRLTLSNIIDTLEGVLKHGKRKYYSNEDVRRLSLIIKNISGEDK